jgi:hypothetical protein
MTGMGILLIVVGILIGMGSVGMDNTNQATTCYEVDGAYGSSGCVETTYYDPSGKMFVAALGVSAIVSGGYLTVKGGDMGNRAGSSGSNSGSSDRDKESTSNSQESSSTLQAQIEDRKNNDQ